MDGSGRDANKPSVAPKRKPRKAFALRNEIPTDQLKIGFKRRAISSRPLQPAQARSFEASNPLIHFRSSRHGIKLQHEVTDTLERLQLGQTWLGFMPMLLGRHKALDFATKAFVAAQAFAAQKHLRTADADVVTCLVPYSHCIREVQSALTDEGGQQSDEVLLAVELLANFETTTQFKRTDSSSGKWLPHTHGVYVG
ncbi:hypothetical protein LTR78_004119 [Recurvomyces mirabilis]|uniref:Uncharacterized protein n=1 Tax=Recurvomyces mirabilis TaxID=574656 RepID=A0AAE1C2W7_9PEZI|nr:hypothetical protein LTR78_004119 [Recurvomyces mirabilis]KAK5153709.1 hypothetical protein LTS14_007403 [Recurvomyces mirabilis]